MCTYICASTVSKCTLMFRSMVRQRRLTLDTSLFVCRSTALLSLDGGYWLQKTLHTPHRHVPLHTPCMCSFSAAGGRSSSPRTLCQNTGSFGAVGGPLLYQSLSYTTGMFWGCVQSVHEIHRHIKETVFQGIFSESWIIHDFIPSHLKVSRVCRARTHTLSHTHTSLQPMRTQACALRPAARVLTHMPTHTNQHKRHT